MRGNLGVEKLPNEEGIGHREYRHKNGPIRGRLYNELVADLHASRYSDEHFRQLRAKHARRNVAAQ